MMPEKLDLGLSLSFNTSQMNHHYTHSPLPFPLHRMPPSSNLLLIPASLNAVDVNKTAKTAEDDDEGASSPPSTLSSVSGGKRSERDAFADALARPLERTSSRGTSDEDDGDNSRKKLRLSKDQSAVLEEFFKDHSTLNPKQKMALAKNLNLRPRQVEVWFQNRRARTKLKQTEVDCEHLKRWCERLNEENRKLQKEITELRAVKMHSPYQISSQMMNNSPATISMCPSCERVSPPNTFSSMHKNDSMSSPNMHQQQQNFFPVAAHAIRNPWPMTS